jgi:hypothetical protein
MYQAKKKRIADGPVTDRIVIGCGLDIGIGIGEEIRKGIKPFKNDPCQHKERNNQPVYRAFI